MEMCKALPIRPVFWEHKVWKWLWVPYHRSRILSWVQSTSSPSFSENQMSSDETGNSEEKLRRLLCSRWQSWLNARPPTLGPAPCSCLLLSQAAAEDVLVEGEVDGCNNLLLWLSKVCGPPPSVALISYFVCTFLPWRPATLSKKTLAVAVVCESDLSLCQMYTEIPSSTRLSDSFTHAVLRCRFFRFRWLFTSIFSSRLHTSFSELHFTCPFLCDLVIITRSEVCKWWGFARHIPLMSPTRSLGSTHNPYYESF